MRRRTFVGGAFAGLSITGLGARPPKPPTGATPMREFGKTGVKLTVIGQGGARLALLRNKEAARAHVRHAYDLGLNYFDCAHSYWDGHSEEVYGDVRFAQRFKPLAAEEMEALRKIAVTAGPGGVKGPALEYWKRDAEGR